jgi:hypothetical protein
MDRPAVDKVDGVPAAIAIDQTNPVRSSRSTVGTMTELNDHLKLLFARAAQLFDKQTAEPVTYDVVGPVCESGDWLGRDRDLTVQQGDLLAVLSAGAYGMSMASNYNTRGRAAEVMVSGDQFWLIQDRERPTELFRGEHLLPAQR